MRRQIVGFHQDDEGDWVAELSCLHGQHVRHRPPFWDRAWVETEPGRRERIGSDIDCPRCDRAELPEGLEVTRTAGPFDADTVPAGLRSAHRTPDRTWGLLRVTEGAVRFRMELDPPLDVELEAGGRQPIPPDVPHQVVVGGPVVLAVDFLTRP